MKRVISFLMMCLLVSGCATVNNLDNLRAENRQKTLLLKIGLTKNEVTALMGTKSATDSEWVGILNGGTMTHTVNNPYRSETLQGKDKVLEVLYYYTDVKRQDNAITDDELTPVVFDNGKVIGWGWGFLEDNKNKYEIRVR